MVSSKATRVTGFVEEMQYGMIGYNVPLSRYPETHNGQPLSLACIASQKNYLSLYLEVVGKTIGRFSVDRYIAMTEAVLVGAKSPPRKKPRSKS